MQIFEPTLNQVERCNNMVGTTLKCIRQDFGKESNNFGPVANKIAFS